MRGYEERAMDFIKEIFPYISADLTSPFIVRMGIRKFNEDFNRKVIMRSGCARIAMITSDYVVKFDYDDEEVTCIGGSQNEVHLYEIAEREGFAYLFAKITHVVWQGYDFYIMPRIYGINDNNNHGWSYMTREEERWCKDHYLTDLHCGNFGFREGHICIVDYGFQEDKVEYNSTSTNYYTSHNYCGMDEISYI